MYAFVSNTTINYMNIALGFIFYLQIYWYIDLYVFHETKFPRSLLEYRSPVQIQPYFIMYDITEIQGNLGIFADHTIS